MKEAAPMANPVILSQGKLLTEDGAAVPSDGFVNAGALATQLAGTALRSYQGTYDASSNLFPATGGSGAAGAIAKGDTFLISVAGTLGGTAVVAGDEIIAEVDAPAQIAASWGILSHALGFISAPVASPTFTGTPAAPTAAQGTNTTQLATTAMVHSEAVLLAPLLSPTFTGTPAAPTAAQGTNTTQVATTAMVHSETVLLAPLASPTFTGTPAAPTPAANDNSTKVATTAYADTGLALRALLTDPLNWGFPFSFHPNTGRNNASVVSNNRRYYLRSYGGGTLTAVKYEVAVQSGNISIALYSNTGTGLNAKPGTRIVTTGSIACPAAGVQSTSLGGTFTLNPGDWFSIACDNTTAQFIAAFNSTAGSTLGAGAFYKEDAAFTAPGTATPVSEAGPAFILIGVA